MTDQKGQKILSKFPYCTNIKDLSQSAGVGLFLYFYFIKICLWTIAIVAILSSAPFMYLSYYTRHDLKSFCGSYASSYPICNERVKNTSNWLLAISSENFRLYKNLTEEVIIKNNIAEGNKPEWSLIDYNFISLITQLVLLFIYLIFYNNVINQSAEVDIVNLTASDYALMVSELRGTNFDNFEKLKEYLSVFINNI